jgi:hypothetical protein
MELIVQYRAVSFRQSDEAPHVVLFAAPATDIAEWAGVPQRELVDQQETIGFQREENPTRISQLKRFLDDNQNVIQNPILCAARNTQKVTFEPDPGATGTVVSGTLTIEDPNLSSRTLTNLFADLEAQLRARQPALSEARVDQQRLLTLQTRLQDAVGEELDWGEQEEDEPAELEDDSVSGLFAKETHVLEFWQEIKARQLLLTQLADTSRFEEEGTFLGFDRETLESYLRPVFLVDGQHRLKGAVESAEAAAAQAMLSEGPERPTRSSEEASEMVREHARIMPVSLLLDQNTAEHVFQFVVVNQKATPVGKALLGTIVASSLTENELEKVASRLEKVGINVTDSQAVSWFTRNKNSPFYGLVQQGMTGEGGDKLPWSVLRDLVSVFRNCAVGDSSMSHHP